MAIEDILSPGELLAYHQRRDQAAKDAAARRTQRLTKRGEGLRLRLTRTAATKGKAKRILETPYYFQCPPLDEFSVPRSFSFNRWTNYKGTEYLSRGGRVLRAITFRTLVVEYGLFVVERDWNLQRLVRNLDTIVASGYPLHLLATHAYNATPEFDADVVLESLNITEPSGENDARYLDLSFVEWDDPVVSRRSQGAAKGYPFTITINKNGTFRANVGGKHPAARLNKLSGGLSLARVARIVYGRPSLAGFLARSQKPAIRGFGAHTALHTHSRFKRNGGTITVPEPPPVATTNPPGNPPRIT